MAKNSSRPRKRGHVVRAASARFVEVDSARSAPARPARRWRTILPCSQPECEHRFRCSACSPAAIHGRRRSEKPGQTPPMRLERVARQRHQRFEQLAQVPERPADPRVFGRAERRIPPFAGGGEGHQHAHGMVLLHLAVGRENVFSRLARCLQKDGPGGTYLDADLIPGQPVPCADPTSALKPTRARTAPRWMSRATSP